MRGSRLAALATLVVGFVVAGPEAAAQGRRALQSRAAFAALDSAALADSSRMIPLAPARGRDARIRALVDFLDGKPLTDSRTTRVRWWNGFGSQAHPALGILVDSVEVDSLLERTGIFKGMAGLPPPEIARRLDYAVDFLVAHEHSHLSQYRLLPRDSVERKELTRVIECSADILGGFQLMTAYYVGAVPVRDSSAAVTTVIDFGHVIGSRDWLDGTTHPLPDARRLCIGIGVGAAGAMSMLVRTRLGDPTADTGMARRWLRENAPELLDPAPNAVRWSVRYADSLVRSTSVATGTMGVAVVRDSSVHRFTLRMAAAADAGHEAFRRLRSSPAPGDRPRFLLRQSLDAPWECTISEERDAETSFCSMNLRASAAGARAAFAALVSTLDSAFAEAGWVRAPSEPDPPDVPAPLGVEGGEVTWQPRAGGDTRTSPSASVSLSDDQGFSATAQLPPRYTFGVTFRVPRAARARPPGGAVTPLAPPSTLR